MNAARHPRRPSIDTHWWASIGFSAMLTGLVTIAIGTDLSLALGLFTMSIAGFGFFHFLFPGGTHFGLTVANFLAFYYCLFEFFLEANFTAAPPHLTMAARALPVAGFLISCVVRRRRVYALIHARQVRDLDLNHLPRLFGWVIATMAVGLASFGLPHLRMDPTAASIALLTAMTIITMFVVIAVRDVVTVMVDVSLVFAAVAARLDRLIVPMMAFTTFYGLLIVVFTCLYRIADLTSVAPQFEMHGTPARIGFTDALYYSVAIITTLGIGDIAPISLLTRALSGLEVGCGILMLLFGFSEIMRGSGLDPEPN